MSKIKSVNFVYISDLAFETRKQFIKHNFNDEHLNRATEEMNDETNECVYDAEEDDCISQPKTITRKNNKDIINSRTAIAGAIIGLLLVFFYFVVMIFVTTI